MSLKFSAVAKLPTKFGPFDIQSVLDEHGNEHLLIFLGELDEQENVLLRIHSECLTSEVLGSLKCDCREQLEGAMRILQDEGQGVIIYLRQEGRGIGLFNKVEAYALQDQGMDTIEANLALGFPVDLRKYGLAVEIIRSLGLQSIRLLTNNPEKKAALRKHGVNITENVPLRIDPNIHNQDYLKLKREKMNHTV